MSIKAHMICHTHWDREWYLTREEFRTKLVRLIDGLLDIVESVPEYVSFMLDGQTIAIEDYLAIKPYRRGELFEALKSGKIICGPWYILPDELLVSGESHIRNYMIGTDVIKECGRKMETAYLPDSFGHPAQMPQIVEGLGMNTMVFWRGVSNAVKKTEFYWESPFSDSRILCVHMPHGYGNSANLSENMEVTVPRIQELIRSLGGKSTTDLVLLMNGSDHIIGQNNISKIVEKLNQQLEGCQVELSTMEKYLEELKENLGELPTFTGEFRSGERSMLLGGTLSTRIYLKQKNDIVQNKAERYLEPMFAIEALRGGKYDSKGYLDYIWKKILENQPHDSICGCSVDAVHQEMMNRFACVEQLENMLMTDCVERASQNNHTDDKGKACIYLFEPAVRSAVSYAEIDIYMDEALVQEVNFTKSIIEDYEQTIQHPEIPSGICIKDECGREIPHVILKAEKDYHTLYQDHTAPEIYKVNKIRAGVLLPPFTYGCHQLFVEPAPSESCKKIKSKDTQIENEYYKLELREKGLVLLNKHTNQEYAEFAKLIDKGDAGDEYTYSWPAKDQEYGMEDGDVSVEKEMLGDFAQSLILTGNLQIPRELKKDRRERSEDLITCPFRFQFTLCRGLNRIDCRLELDNRAKDHRLQVQFPSGINSEYSESYDIFNITQHSVNIPVPKEWMEYPQSTHPTHGYIGVHNQSKGMSIGTKGLTEYEAVQTGETTAINLTLLRCVGWLSRTDLLTRHGNGGWTIETPEGQCLGKHTFEFCVKYHDNQTNKAFDIIEKFRYPSYLKSMREGSRNLWISNEIEKMISSLPEGIQLSALKPSENRQGVILRIYSIADTGQKVSMTVPEEIKRIYITDLKEKPIEKMNLHEKKVNFQIESNQILTLYLEI